MNDAARAEAPNPTRILIVDDEPDIELMMRQKMRRKLRKGLYALEFALNGREALKKLENGGEREIDMVVTDINMPIMNGLELLAEIAKRRPGLKSIVVSAYGDMDNIRIAMNLGAFDFVTKPVDFVDLEATIERTEEHIRTWRTAMRSRDQVAVRRSEIEIARTMQRAAAPPEMPESHRYQLHAMLEPTNEIAGDFYDVVRLEDEKLGIAVADVSGRGVGAALFMTGSRSVLKGTAIGSSDPATVLSEMNEVVSGDNPESRLVSLVYAVYHPRTGEVRYANGGHPAPFVIDGEGRRRGLDPVAGMAIGVSGEAEFGEGEAALEPGETLILYCDGLIRARNQAGEEFGAKGIEGAFAAGPPATAREAVERIFEDVKRFAGGREIEDDIVCLALRRS